MKATGRDFALGIVMLLAAIVALNSFTGGGAPTRLSAIEVAAVLTIDASLILLALSFALWRGILWQSFLHPESYLRSAAGSLGTAFGLAVLEVPLAVAYAVIVLMGTDCSNGGSYWAGTCGYYPAWAIAMATVWTLMAVTAVLAGLALVRALILVVLRVRSVAQPTAGEDWTVPRNEA